MTTYDKLADDAKDPNIVALVHALPNSEFIAHVRHEHAAYHALAGSSATDAGATAYMRERWSEAQAAWARDVARITGQRDDDEVPKTR
jgi:hypothetical protein